MSRIGRKPITIPSGVDVTIGEQNYVEVKGPKGTLSGRFHTNLTITKDDSVVTVERPDDQREHRAVHGLTRTLISNMVVGVTDGFKKNLEIQGVGYRAAIDGPTKIIVSGSNKQQVGEEAARIRRARPPEPYKGKGIRYEGEYVRRKAGKTGKAK